MPDPCLERMLLRIFARRFRDNCFRQDVRIGALQWHWLIFDSSSILYSGALRFTVRCSHARKTIAVGAVIWPQLLVNEPEARMSHNAALLLIRKTHERGTAYQQPHLANADGVQILETFFR